MPEETKKYKLKGIELADYSESTYRLEAPPYLPSKKAQEIITNVWTRFTEMRTNRDLNYRWFGKTRDGTYRNLIQYINICEKRWNSDGIPRTELEEWQASVFKPETRNKVIAILSAVAQQRPRMKFKGVEKSDYLREQILKDLYDWSENKDDGDEMALYTMLDSIVHGTAIRYEGYEDCRKVIKEITEDSGNYDEIQFKEKTIIEKKLTTKDVRIQDFYFGNMSIRRMEDQTDCVWRRLVRISDFKREFAGWPESKYVIPGGDLTDETFFASVASEDVKEQGSELVEVLRYYNKDADEFVILANGVWVNPIKTKVSPIPFSHKQLPFYSVFFEPFAIDFPYGKALPDKMLNEQDAINALYNMILDQGYVSVHKPLVTGDEDALDDIDLIPGKVNYIGADVANIHELQISPPSPAHFSILQMLQSSIEQTTVDSVQQGQTGEAGTATEVRQAAAAASRQFLLFLQFVFHGYKRQAKLRVSNILQFMTSPVEIEKMLGDNGEEDFREAFQVFKVEDTQLMNGKNGTRVIEMVGDEKELEQKYNNRLKEREELEPLGVEKVYITPEYIRNWQYDVEPIPGSTINETEEIQQALEVQFQQQVLTLYPDMVNRESLFDEFLRVFKKDPRNIKLAPGQPNPMMMQQQQGGGGIAGQIVNRATGGRQNNLGGSSSLNQLNPR